MVNKLKSLTFIKKSIFNLNLSYINNHLKSEIAGFHKLKYKKWVFKLNKRK